MCSSMGTPLQFSLCIVIYIYIYIYTPVSRNSYIYLFIMWRNTKNISNIWLPFVIYIILKHILREIKYGKSAAANNISVTRRCRVLAKSNTWVALCLREDTRFQIGPSGARRLSRCVECILKRPIYETGIFGKSKYEFAYKDIFTWQWQHWI